MADFIEHHYSRPTTPAGAGFDYTILEGVEVQNETDFSASAALGEADICKVVVDDPNAVWDFAGHRRWYLAEKAISSNTLVWTGYIGQQRVHRRNADTGSNITGTGRVWELDLVELNAILSFRIITGSDGNRAAETAGARLTWLLSSDYLSTVFDNGLVVYPTTAMDAVDYRGQTAADVLRDLALATGYNFFAYYDETAATDQRVSLFFDDANTSTAYTSFIRVSNVLSDVESAPNNTFAPLSDAVLMRDPTNVAAGVYLPYDGGSVYDYNLTTSYNFGFRDKAAPSSNVKTAAKANAILSRLLAQHDEQDDKVSCSIILPASQLNDIKHGQRMQAKFSHFPAPYNDWTWYRVLSKTFSRPENGATDRYVVGLELSPQPTTTDASVFAILAHRDPVTSYIMPGGWTVETEVGAADDGVTILSGPLDEQTLTITLQPNSNYAQLAAVQFRGLASSGFVAATESDPSFDLSFDIQITTTGAGIILAGIRIHNFDAGARTLTDPGGWVVIYRRMNQEGASDRDWGVVSFGYVPVAAAGTYTLTWTMSNQFNWYKDMAALFIPYATDASAFEMVQVAPGVLMPPESNVTFPDPL